jgi:hypothetical protein
MLKINTPHVVHETIDGETILLHLNTGNYYSFDGFGAIIWQGLILTGSIKTMIEKLGLNEEQSEEVKQFNAALLEEELLIEDGEEASAKDSSELAELLKEAGDYATPQLHKYADLQELLLLDPIHDVEEKKGWPEAK